MVNISRINKVFCNLSFSIFLVLAAMVCFCGCEDNRETKRKADEERKEAEKRAILQTLQSARQINNCILNIQRALKNHSFDRMQDSVDELKENLKLNVISNCPDDFQVSARQYFNAQEDAIKSLIDFLQQLRKLTNLSSQDVDNPAAIQVLGLIVLLNEFSPKFDRHCSTIKMKYLEMLDCAELYGVSTQNFKN